MDNDELKELVDRVSDVLDDVYRAEEGTNLLADHLKCTEQPHGDHAVRMHEYMANAQRKLERLHHTIEKATLTDG